MAPQSNLDETLSAPHITSSRNGAVSALTYLWARRSFIGRAVGFALLVSIITALLIPNRYQSTARLMPPDNQKGGLALLSALSASGGAGGLGLLAGDLLGAKNTGDLFVGVLESRTVSDAIINKFDLRSVYGQKTYVKTRKELSRYTEIAQDRKSGVISLTVTDKNPDRAAKMAQEYVDQLDRLVAELYTSSAGKERKFLEERLKVAQQELDEATLALSKFSSANRTLDLKEQGKATVEAAAALKGQMIAAEAELKGLEQIYTSENVRVKSLRARINSLRGELAKLTGAHASSEQDLDYVAPSITRLPLVGVTYIGLYREVRIHEAVFESLTKAYELARVEEAKNIPIIKVLDPPDVPEKKSSPPRTAIVLLGTSVGFLLSVAAILGKRKWDTWDGEMKAFVTLAARDVGVGNRERWSRRR